MSISTNNFNSSSNSGGSIRTGSSPAVLEISATSNNIVVPGGDMLLRADFERHGEDLLITSSDGGQFVIVGYFNSLNPIDLLTDGGAMLPFDLVSTLAGPVAPNQYAQSEDNIGSSPIGRVDEAIGEVLATRVDGTTVALAKDSPVFEGDVLETGAGGAVAVVFIDETEFSLGEDGRMVLDELIFDPTSMEGSSTFSVVQGVFVFVSGEIAANNPDEMLVKTPVAVIGIRGTKVAGKAAAEGELNTVTMMPESEGAVIGTITVSTQTTSITLNTAYQTTAVSSVFEAPAAPITLSANQAGTLYGAVSSLLPATSAPAKTSSATDRREDDTSSNTESAVAGNAGDEASPEGESASNEEGVVPLDEAPLEELAEANEEDLNLEEGLEAEVEFGPEGELGPRENFGPEGELGPNEGFGPEGDFSPEDRLANLSPEEAVALAEELGFEPPKIGPDGELALPEGFSPDGEFSPKLSPDEAIALAKELGFSPDGAFGPRVEIGPDGELGPTDKFGPEGELGPVKGFGPEGEYGKETFVVAGLAAAEDAFNVLQETFESGGTFDEAFQAADSAGSVAFNAYMGAAGTDMFEALVDFGPEAVFADPSALNTFGGANEGQFNKMAESFGIDPKNIGVADDFGQRLAPISEFEGDFGESLKDDPELANALRLPTEDRINLEGEFGPNENFGNLSPDEAAALAKEGGFSPEGELGPKDRLAAEAEFGAEKGIKVLPKDGQGPGGEFEPSGQQVKELDSQSLGSAKPISGDMGPGSSKIGSGDFGPNTPKIGASDLGPSTQKIGSGDFGSDAPKFGPSDLGSFVPKLGSFSFKQDFKQFFKFKPPPDKKEDKRNEENQSQKEDSEVGVRREGGSGSDTLTGTSGNDLLIGLGGADTLFGLSGKDSLSGGDGVDVLEGNAGVDTLTGGNGADFFFYSTPKDGAPALDTQTGLQTGDVITDFTSGDKFEFLNSGFGFTGTGTLSSGSFRSLTVAFDGTNSGISGSDAYFVFDQTTDTLYHDFDQTVNGYSVIATVQSGASVTNADITLNA